ncbi:MAG: chromosome partitioning protein [Microbacterium sp.]|nr:MAG: chromosome partitioning protein [Microbacterium sp.]PZU32892.1 MAG: chromosome partitioning protein [Microbacterium sp.]
MHLTDYIVIVRRNWLIVLSSLLIGGAVGMMIALATPTRYEASTRSFVAVSNTGAASDLNMSTNYARQAVASFVTIVPTALVLDPVIADLDLGLSSRELASRVTASAAPNSQVIEITVSDASPSDAAQIANAVTESFSSAVADRLERPTRDGEPSKVRIELLSPAHVPTTPVAPNMSLSILLGLLVGAAAGVSIAVLRTTLDTRIHTLTDVESALDTPILGGIPFDPDAASEPLIVNAAPRDPRAEAYRTVRTNLQFLDLGAGTPSLVVTSAAPGEGKTVACANIALALAETGARVALVDGDLRSPRLDAVFGLEGYAGLTEVLTGRATLARAMQPWGAGKLFLLMAGTRPPNPSELLGSGAMERVLHELEEAFDFILFDSPPLLAVTDAAVMARHTRGAVLVAASGYTRTPQLADAAKSLSGADALLRGVLMTKLPTRGPDSAAYAQYTYAVTHGERG